MEFYASHGSGGAHFPAMSRPEKAARIGPLLVILAVAHISGVDTLCALELRGEMRFFCASLS